MGKVLENTKNKLNIYVIYLAIIIKLIKVIISKKEINNMNRLTDKVAIITTICYLIFIPHILNKMYKEN